MDTKSKVHPLPLIPKCTGLVPWDEEEYLGSFSHLMDENLRPRVI